MNDLVIRHGTVVMPEGTIRADVAIEGETISNVGSDLPPASKEIDATGCAILPGMIDVHVHFNEPGHTEWEGAATGSRALAANGGTLFFDIPFHVP
jgi:allantoinase